jgi:mRNA interferase RelE/StbE
VKTIVFSHQAEKDLAALPAEGRSTVRLAIYKYAMEGIGDTKRLRGSNFHRLRIGRYRVIFAEDNVTVIAIYIGKRETTTYGRGRI